MGRHDYANVTIMTPCDRRCPRCCCRDVVTARGQIFSPEEIARDVLALGDVPHVLLTGGEPTLHPRFDEVVLRARIARGERRLILNTNGARVLEHLNSIVLFDELRLSVFTDRSNTGDERTDLALVQAIRDALAGEVEVLANETIHEDTGGGLNACERIENTISTMDGRVYACCVASGIAGAASTKLTAGWEERLAAVPAPCASCVFGKA
jgi:hypothetical protein